MGVGHFSMWHVHSQGFDYGPEPVNIAHLLEPSHYHDTGLSGNALTLACCKSCFQPVSSGHLSSKFAL